MSTAYTTTRYVPLTQQRCLCLPTCVQMVMLHQNLPLLPAETIGNALGLVVPTDCADLFESARSAPTHPNGFGTRINVPRYDFNTAMTRLGVPLAIHRIPVTDLGSPRALTELLRDIEARDGDALITYRYDGLFNGGGKNGHVNLFDRVRGNRVRLIEPGADCPKFTQFAPSVLYAALTLTSPGPVDHILAGVWEITRTD